MAPRLKFSGASPIWSINAKHINCVPSALLCPVHAPVARWWRRQSCEGWRREGPANEIEIVSVFFCLSQGPGVGCRGGGHNGKVWRQKYLPGRGLKIFFPFQLTALIVDVAAISVRLFVSVCMYVCGGAVADKGRRVRGPVLTHHKLWTNPGDRFDRCHSHRRGSYRWGRVSVGCDCLGSLLFAPGWRGVEAAAVPMEISHQLMLTSAVFEPSSSHQPLSHSSGAVWESRWTSWAVRPNEPSGFRGRKDLLNHASALVSVCP